MTDPMRDQLGAYLDGELPGPDRLALQRHLETCPACREELAALRQLSQALRADPLPAALPPARQFAEQLVLRLPPRPAQPAGWWAGSAGWLVPLGLVTVLVFWQASQVLGLLAGLLGAPSLPGPSSAWFAPGPGQPVWLTAGWDLLRGTLSLEVPSGLQAASEVLHALQVSLVTPLLWQLTLALVYLACLAAWWRSRRGAAFEAKWNSGF